MRRSPLPRRSSRLGGQSAGIGPLRGTFLPRWRSDSRGRMSAQEKVMHFAAPPAGTFTSTGWAGNHAPEGLLEANAPRVQDNVLPITTALHAKQGLPFGRRSGLESAPDHPAGVFTNAGEVGESARREGRNRYRSAGRAGGGKRAQPEEVRHGGENGHPTKMVAGEEVALPEGVAFTLKVEVSGSVMTR